MNHNQDLFDQYDRFFAGEATEPLPESIRPFFEWLSCPNPNSPHTDAVEVAVKRVISDMSAPINTLMVRRPIHICMSDNLARYYNLRSDIYEGMDKYYRIWWDIFSDRIR